MDPNFTPQGYLYRLPAVGGQGGGEYDHAAWACEQGTHLGCGGLVLEELRVHAANAADLHRMFTLYRSYGGCPAEGQQGSIEAPWHGWIDGGHRARLGDGPAGDAAKKDPLYCVKLPRLAAGPAAGGGDERVACLHASVGTWDPRCVRFLAFEVAPVPDDGSRKKMRISRSRYLGVPRETLNLPPGVALAGLHGRSGWFIDQIGFYTCPAVPDRWSCMAHTLCPPPFKQQVRTLLCCLRHGGLASQGAYVPQAVQELLVATLFHATFKAPGAGGVPGSDCIADWLVGEVQGLGWATRPAGEAASSEDEGGADEEGGGEDYDEEEGSQDDGEEMDDE